MILLNASNLKGTGVTQVALALIYGLEEKDENYIVFASPQLASQILNLNRNYSNKIRVFNTKNIIDLIRLNYSYLTLKKKFKDLRLTTVFGPNYIFFAAKHNIGFAYPHITYPEYLIYHNTKLSIINKIRYSLYTFNYKLYSKKIIVETENIADRIRSMWKIPCEVGPNTVNPIIIENSRNKNFSSDKTTKTILCASSNMDHKNLRFIETLACGLEKKQYDFKILLTISNEDAKRIGINNKRIQLVGRLNVNELSQLYLKCDFTINPSLLECFSGNLIESYIFKKWHICNNQDFNKINLPHILLAEPNDVNSWVEIITKISLMNPVYDIEPDFITVNLNKRFNAYFH